jgi:hypothetical protein
VFLLLALVLADLAIAVANFADVDVVGINAWADLAAAVALVAAFMLLGGWAFRRPVYASHGVAMSAGVWAALAVVYASTVGIHSPSSWLAIAWTLAAIGAFLVTRARGTGVE